MEARLDKITHFLNHIPLIGLVAARAKAITGTRILDGILIAVISSAISSSAATFFTTRFLAEMNSKDISNLKSIEEEHHAEAMMAIKQIQRDLYVPRNGHP